MKTPNTFWNGEARSIFVATLMLLTGLLALYVATDVLEGLRSAGVVK